MGNLKQIRLLTLDDVFHFSTKGRGTCVPYTLQKLLISYSATWHKSFALLSLINTDQTIIYEVFLSLVTTLINFYENEHYIE